MITADKPLPAAFKDLASDHEAIKKILSDLGLAQEGENITVKALTGGVSSNIFQLTTKDAQYCLKQALPQLKVAKQWLAPVDRVFAEIDWLQTAATIAPDAVPHILGVDQASKSFVMQHLGAEYLNWKSELLAGRLTDKVATHLVQHHKVSALQLRLQRGGSGPCKLRESRLGVHHARDAGQRHTALGQSVSERCGVGQARCLQQHRVHVSGGAKHLLQRLSQLRGAGAAAAALRKRQQREADGSVYARAAEERAVYVHARKLVHDHGEAEEAAAAQQGGKHRRLSGAQEAADNDARHLPRAGSRRREQAVLKRARQVQRRDDVHHRALLTSPCRHPPGERQRVAHRRRRGRCA